jgi:hypothetical protein
MRMLNFFLCVYHTITHIILKKYYWSLSQCPNLNSFRINVLVLSCILVRSFSMKINSCWIKISFVLILKVSKYWPMQLLIHVDQCSGHVTLLRRVWRYQRGNQNPYIEEQTTQWRTEKVQKDKQRCTKHTYRTKGLVTRIPLKIGVNPGAPEGSADPAPLVAPVVLI